MSGSMLMFRSKQAIVFHFVLSPHRFIQSCNHGERRCRCKRCVLQQTRECLVVSKCIGPASRRRVSESASLAGRQKLGATLSRTSNILNSFIDFVRVSLTMKPTTMKLLGVCLLLVEAGAQALAGQEPLQAGTKHLTLTHDLIGLHENLTSIESITGNEKAVGEWLYSSLQSQGYKVEKQYVEKEPARFNVFAWPGEARESAKVLVTSHIDTVSSPRMTTSSERGYPGLLS